MTLQKIIKGMDTDDHKSPFSEWIRSPQTMIALSAVLLSLCGLFISIYEASLIREQQRASVWPNVEVSPSFSGNSVRIFVQNTGVGPARVQAARVSVDGEIKRNWQDAVRAVTGDEDVNINWRSLINGRVLPPDSPQELIFRLETPQTPAEQVQALKSEIARQKFDVTLCYCSVYDECWTASMNDVTKRFNGEEVPSREERKVLSCEFMDHSGI